MAPSVTASTQQRHDACSKFDLPKRLGNVRIGPRLERGNDVRLENPGSQKQHARFVAEIRADPVQHFDTAHRG